MSSVEQSLVGGIDTCHGELRITMEGSSDDPVLNGLHILLDYQLLLAIVFLLILCCKLTPISCHQTTTLLWGLLLLGVFLDANNISCISIACE